MSSAVLGGLGDPVLRRPSSLAAPGEADQSAEQVRVSRRDPLRVDRLAVTEDAVVGGHEELRAALSREREQVDLGRVLQRELRQATREGALLEGVLGGREKAPLPAPLEGVLARVNPTPARSGPKLGRNQACSCGSGKKLERCCEAAASSRDVSPRS